MNKGKIPVVVSGATGFVGVQYLRLLSNHPWFTVQGVAASSRSAGRQLGEVLSSKGFSTDGIAPEVLNYTVQDAAQPIAWREQAKIVFSAFDLDKKATKELENHYAQLGLAVVSNNSAHRDSEDVPVIVPEVNADHLQLLSFQKKNRNWDGCIICKPNCSVQSYLPALKALEPLGVKKVIVQTMQAISGAGKSLDQAPEIADNVMPLPSEARKSEYEPLKILGKVNGTQIIPSDIIFSAQSVRVPVSDGHLVNIFIELEKKVGLAEVKELLQNFTAEPRLPSSPEKIITIYDESDKPQTRHDRDQYHGMGIVVGQLMECPVLGIKMSTLSHNLIRGAAGGAVLSAELLVAQGFVK